MRRVGGALVAAMFAVGAWVSFEAVPATPGNTLVGAVCVLGAIVALVVAW